MLLMNYIYVSEKNIYAFAKHRYGCYKYEYASVRQTYEFNGVRQEFPVNIPHPAGLYIE